MTLHEAVIENVNFIWEIAMDSDYILFFFSRHNSFNSEIQIRSTSTFQVLNTIVLDDGATKFVFQPYLFHYLNGLIAIGFEDTYNLNAKWIRFNFKFKNCSVLRTKLNFVIFRVWDVKTNECIKKIPCSCSCSCSPLFGRVMGVALNCCIRFIKEFLCFYRILSDK